MILSQKANELPVFDSDVAIPSYTWRELMDIYVANYGHDVTKGKFKEHMKEIVKSIQNQMFDEFELISDAVVESIREEGT